jgi:Mg2+/Co2+ transporter CorB
VIHEARTIPEVGQRFAFFGYKFEILRRQRNQITALRVTPPAGDDKDAMPPG